MFLHNKRMQYTVHVDEPNPLFAKLLLEQFGGANGELAAAMRYFTQALGESDVPRRDMLFDIATEELSHLEMVGQLLVLLLKGTKCAMIDEVEGSYLGDLLDKKHAKYQEEALTGGMHLLSGGAPRLVNEDGDPWTAAYIDSMGHPLADLRSDIAAEARAKVTYDRLIKSTDDNGVRDTLTFLMTREVAHQKMFESALAAIENNFPSSNVKPDDRFTHAYFNASTNGKGDRGFELANGSGLWKFTKHAMGEVGEEAPLPTPKPSVASKIGSVRSDDFNPTSRASAEVIAGKAPTPGGGDGPTAKP
ncbi:MAG TPA: manganese catalase family protein [Candidatus Baltobacteraceae bacterium]|nr:manganese catalase family protein [Candidatus Baltobacteraceae bacterium]